MVSLEILRIALSDTAFAAYSDHESKMHHSYYIHRANVVGSRFLLSLELNEIDAESFSRLTYERFGVRMHKVDKKDIVYNSLINRSVERQKQMSPRYSRAPLLIYEIQKPELSSWIADFRNNHQIDQLT